MLKATPEQLAKVDAALTDTAPPPPCLRLLRMGEAAKLMGVSRTTIFRMVRDGRLPTAELRKGLYRIPERAIRELVGV